MKLKTYLPLIVLTVCLVVVLCLSSSWFATSTTRYSVALGSTTPVQLNSSVVSATAFQSVTPDYRANRNTVRTQYSEATASTTTSSSVFSNTTFHQPQVTSFSGGASTGTASAGHITHAATSSAAPAAVSVSLPTPKRNSQAATPRTSDAQAAAQANSGTSTYTAHALPMRSSSKSASADASVAPMATTTYDDGYSINGGANKISGRRNTGDDPFGGGTLPANPKEPGVPMGDMPWALMLILAAGYAIFHVGRRHCLASPESRDQK